MASGSKKTCKHAIGINILVSLAISSEMLVNYLFASLEMPSGSIEIDKITLPAVKAEFTSTFVMSMMCVSTSSSFQHRRLRAVPSEKIQIGGSNLERECRQAHEDLHFRGHARHCAQIICMPAQDKSQHREPHIGLHLELYRELHLSTTRKKFEARLYARPPSCSAA